MAETTPHLDALTDAGMELLRARYHARGEFLSDSDVLDVADRLVPVDRDAEIAGDLDAELHALTYDALVDRLYALCMESDEDADGIAS